MRFVNGFYVGQDASGGVPVDEGVVHVLAIAVANAGEGGGLDLREIFFGQEAEDVNADVAAWMSDLGEDQGAAIIGRKLPDAAQGDSAIRIVERAWGTGRAGHDGFEHRKPFRAADLQPAILNELVTIPCRERVEGTDEQLSPMSTGFGCEGCI